jgi:hypothetical protein
MGMPEAAKPASAVTEDRLQGDDQPGGAIVEQRDKRNHSGAQVGRHALRDRRDDLYETPPEATRALLAAERLPHIIWEPAAGRGAIVNVLRARGHEVVATDLVDYGVPGQTAGVDFLMERTAPPGVEAAISNPPYKNAEAFVRHALDLVPQVYFLLQLQFLASKRRHDIISHRLRAVHVFANRLPMIHRDGWSGPRASSATDYAWFCWERDHKGSAIVDQILWVAK